MQTSQLRGEAQFGIAECYEAMAKQGDGAAAAQLQRPRVPGVQEGLRQFPESGRVGEAVAKMANYYYSRRITPGRSTSSKPCSPNQPDAKFLDVILFNYGRCLFRMERKADARRQFDQLIAEFPESPLAADAKRISEALAKVGDSELRPTEAQVTTTRSLRRQPRQIAQTLHLHQHATASTSSCLSSQQSFVRALAASRLRRLPAIAASQEDVRRVSKQAATLEAELGKYKDTTPEAAEAMVKLVDLYHADGRLFGLVRVGAAVRHRASDRRRGTRR